MWPFLSWLISALIDVKFDPRFTQPPNPQPSNVPPEQVQAYADRYFVAITMMNSVYYILTKDLKGFLIAQGGYMAGTEDVLYFALKNMPIPDQLPYLRSYMNTKEKLMRNSLFASLVAAADVVE